MLRFFFCAGIGAAALFLFLSGANAATIATDNAANAPYNDGWGNGDNGGTGWGGGWTFRNGGNAVQNILNSGFFGTFVNSSLGNNNPGGSDSNGDGDINSPVANRAWGMYANTANELYAIRPFAAPLQVGHTVKWDIDNGNVDGTRVLGLRFLSNAADINTRVFEARFVGGDTFYTLIGTPNQTTTIPFSREGFHLEYTLTAANAYSLKIVRKQDGATQTLTGSNVNANSINALAFRNLSAGSGATNNGYLNNISIMSPNVAPIVQDHTELNVNASIPGLVQHTFTATDADLDPLTWGSFAFGTYTPDYGGGPGGPAQPGGSQLASFNTSTREFEWDTVGSPRGIYTWNVTASDGQGGSDVGTITVHVTEVPEPATIGLLALATLAMASTYRRSMGQFHDAAR
jgi:hypothetical protein